MKCSIKNIFIAILVSMVVVGCASNQPFKQSVNTPTISNHPGVSRLTITAVNNVSMRKTFGNDFAIGTLKLNDELMGNFNREHQVFSHEIMPGRNVIEITIDGMIGAPLKVALDAEPNKHYFYRYDLNMNYVVIGYGFNLKLTPIEVRPYKNSQVPEINIKSEPITPKISDQNQNRDSNINSLENAKKKCIELGLKPGTESFGNCVMKIAK
jgi:hypothetical protein